METALLHTGIKQALLLNAFQWRYATQIFDPHLKVPEDKFDVLLEVLRLSPSYQNLQPWKFVVVRNKSIRRELKKYTPSVSQLTDASHLIVLCSLRNINASYVDRLLQKEQQLSENQDAHVEELRADLVTFIKKLSPEEVRNWMDKQVYTALGFLLSACALLHIDACPLEDINKSKFDKILSCHQFGIKARLAVAIGYRSKEDIWGGKKKARWSADEVIITI